MAEPRSGPGRPRSPDARRHVVAVRLSERQYAALERAARHGEGISEAAHRILVAALKV